MRPIALLLATTFSLSAGEPTEALLKFLEKVKASEGSFENLDGLAISPFVGPNQEKEIKQSWENLAEWAKSDEVVFSAGSEKVEGDLAAVLASGIGKSGPDELRVLGFGLVKNEAGWELSLIHISEPTRPY